MKKIMMRCSGLGLWLLGLAPVACTTTTTTTTAAVHGEAGVEYRSATMPHELITRR